MEQTSSQPNSSRSLLGPAAVLGLCVMIGMGSIACALYKTRLQRDTLSVTGSARQKVKSDAVKWAANFSRTVEADGLKQGYPQMRDDEAAVGQFLRDNGFTDADFTISPVVMEEPYQYDPNAPKRYVLRQSVELRAADVDKVTALAKNIQPLIDKGLLFATSYLEYTYTKLPELRISLLGDAMADAKLRAQKVAESSGRTVGTVTSATSGVVQVLQVNSTDVSDYGSYDTSTIDKEVMMTVRPTFSLR